jgi:thiamine-monophosphate kinase
VRGCGGDEIAGDEGSVADLGEFGVIAALRARLPAGPLTSVGIGDDAAVVAAPSGSVVAAVDLLIEGRHFRRDWSAAYDVGVKAAARSLADIAAMGAVSTALLVALAAPGTLPARWAAELADGLAAEAARAGAGVVGGDTARADLVILSVTALGDLTSRPVLRSGARPGDLVAVAGPLGRSAAGLALLQAGRRGTFTELVAAHRRPAPPYDAGPEAALLGATAMIDVSDGLLADLGHVAAASGVQVDVDSARLAPGDALLQAAASLAAPPSSRTKADNPAPPVTQNSSEAVRRHAQSADASAGDRKLTTPPAGSPQAVALEWVLTGGEDHALVAAFPPDTALPARWRVIGQVRDGAGVTVDGAPHHGPGGWQHFR